MKTEHIHPPDERPQWGLYAGPTNVLATCRSFTIEGAIAHFRRLPETLRGRMDPSNQNVRIMR